jgi:hypothetical protein
MPVGTVVYNRPTRRFLLCRNAARNTGKKEKGRNTPIWRFLPFSRERKNKKRTDVKKCEFMLSGG